MASGHLYSYRGSKLRTTVRSAKKVVDRIVKAVQKVRTSLRLMHVVVRCGRCTLDVKLSYIVQDRSCYESRVMDVNCFCANMNNYYEKNKPGPDDPPHSSLPRAPG